MNLKVKKSKKAVSPVITTVFLILLSILAVFLIAGVVIPFVRNSLSESKECFDTLDQLEINTESGYTCYYVGEDGKAIANLTIKRGMKEIGLGGFIISVSDGATSKSFKITEEAISSSRIC